MEIVHSIDPSQNAGIALTVLLIKYQTRPVLLLLSGGSSLQVLPSVDGNLLGKNITLGIIDERCSQNESERNFPKLAATDFFQTGIKNGVGVITPTILPCSNADEVAEDWGSQLRNWFIQNPDGVCVATLGIGPDGHVAGMFPGDWGVDFNSDAWVISYSVPPEVNQFTKRITTTSTFLLNKVDHTIIFATGEEKKSVLKIIEEKSDNLEKIPAKILYKLKSAVLFTD